MTSNSLCLDASYLVSLFDETDLRHFRAREIDVLLRQHQVLVAYLDCVLNELYTVLARRCRERSVSKSFPVLVDQVAQAVPDTVITWLYPRLPGWYSRCLGIMRQTLGQLNFHDSLIVVAMQELGFSALVSFDTGFDQVPWVRRLGSTEAVTAWLNEDRLEQ